MRSFKTAKGTELQILDLRGQDYLQVKWRLVWFREERPTWGIETSYDLLTEKGALCKAVIKDDTGRVVATGHKYEDPKGFQDFMEKAETGAIGRALALIGYGTQFCADELEEGKRIVDSPVVAIAHAERSAEAPYEGDSNEYIVPFGKKYKGMKLKDIARPEIESYIAWLEKSAADENKPLSHPVKTLKAAVEDYWGASPAKPKITPITPSEPEADVDQQPNFMNDGDVPF